MTKKTKKKETNLRKFLKKITGLLLVVLAVLFYIAVFSYHQRARIGVAFIRSRIFRLGISASQIWRTDVF